MPDTMPEAAPTQEAPPTPAEASTFDAMAKHFETTRDAMTSDDAPELSNEVHEKVPAKKEAAPPKTEAKIEVDSNELIAEKPEAEKEKEESEEVLELPPSASKKAHDVFWKQGQKLEAARLEREKLIGTIDALRKAPKEDAALKNEVETLRKRLADSEAIIERSAFEHSPKFKEYAAREQQQMKLAEAYLDVDMKPDVLQAAAVARGRQRIKILQDAGMDGEGIAAIMPHLSAIDTIQQQKSEALEKQGELSAQWESEQKHIAQQKEAYERQEEERTFEEVQKWAEENMAPYQKVEGNEKWNAQVDRLKAQAREFALGKMPVKNLFELGMAGLAYKVEAKRSAMLAEMLKAEREKTAKMSTAQPDLGITNGATRTNGSNGMSLDQQRAASFDAALGR